MKPCTAANGHLAISGITVASSKIKPTICGHAMTTKELALKVINSSAELTERRSEDRDTRLMRLTDDQQMVLSAKRQFGWRVIFHRQPPFGEAEVVITDDAHSAFWVLGRDGSLKETFNIRTEDFV